MRLKELTSFAFRTPGTGLYRCRGGGVDFELTNGVVTDFNAQTAASSPDLARGYTLTCVKHIDEFYQIEGKGKYILQFFPSEDQYGESVSCQARIIDLGSRFRVESLGCQSECMRFNFVVSKSGKECWHER